jgi:hypothetical protein
MKSQYVLMKDSAVNMATKRNSLTQEVKRRLQNCHEDVPKCEVAEILSQFAQKLKNSGYREKFRWEVINAGVLAHNERVKLDKKGEKVLYRDRNDNKASRKRSKIQNAHNWWKQVHGEQEVPYSVIKVPFTPNSLLMKQFQEVTKKHEFPIKFMELSGYSLQNLLEKSNPFQEDTCGRPDCFSCTSGGGGRCDKIGASYEIICDEDICNDRNVKYCGESGRPGYTRGLEHRQGYKAKNLKNALWKHAVNEHGGGRQVKYIMKILKTYSKDNITRKVNEAIRISNHDGLSLNSKAEFRQPTVPRLVIQRNPNIE